MDRAAETYQPAQENRLACRKIDAPNYFIFFSSGFTSMCNPLGYDKP